MRREGGRGGGGGETEREEREVVHSLLNYNYAECLLPPFFATR